MLAYKDNLQVKTTTKAGWLLGLHPTVLNPRDLKEALSLLPEMKGIPIEIRIAWVSIDKGDLKLLTFCVNGKMPSYAGGLSTRSMAKQWTGTR